MERKKMTFEYLSENLLRRLYVKLGKDEWFKGC